MSAAIQHLPYSSASSVTFNACLPAALTRTRAEDVWKNNQHRKPSSVTGVPGVAPTAAHALYLAARTLPAVRLPALCAWRWEAERACAALPASLPSAARISGGDIIMVCAHSAPCDTSCLLPLPYICYLPAWREGLRRV